jgi:hypothetical protein
MIRRSSWWLLGGGARCNTRPPAPASFSVRSSFFLLVWRASERINGRFEIRKKPKTTDLRTDEEAPERRTSTTRGAHDDAHRACFFFFCFLSLLLLCRALLVLVAALKQRRCGRMRSSTTIRGTTSSSSKRIVEPSFLVLPSASSHSITVSSRACVVNNLRLVLHYSNEK